MQTSHMHRAAQICTLQMQLQNCILSKQGGGEFAYGSRKEEEKGS